MFHAFQMYIYLDVVCISSRCCICCNGYTRMLQVYVSNISAVSNVCCKCFIRMWHMLQWPYTYVVSSILDVCCRKCFMLQMFHEQPRKNGCRQRWSPRAREAKRTCQQAHAYRSSRRGWASRHDDNSSNSVRTGATAPCRRAGRSCMHALWVLPRQSGKRRHDTHVPSLAACIQESASPALFPAACRESASSVWAGSRRGHPERCRVRASGR